MNDLAGKRIVVIGGSSGIGRGVAVDAAQRGAAVVVAARRADRLAEVCAEHPGITAVSLDLRDATSRATFAEAVLAEFDEVDVLFIASGAAPLRSLVDSDEEDWRYAIETNLVGVNRVIASFVTHLAPSSITLVVSSESVGEPRSHLGAYGASKAALEHSIAQWREEHPWLRFAVVNIGATIPTEFGNAFDSETLLVALDAWAKAGRSQAKFLDTDEVCTFLGATISSLVAAPSIDMRHIVLRSPSPPELDAEVTRATAAEHGQGGP